MASKPPPSPLCPSADLSLLSAVLSINAPEGLVQSLPLPGPGLGVEAHSAFPLLRKSFLESLQTARSRVANGETEG